MNNGGPAFPIWTTEDDHGRSLPREETQGMTLRDYFAAKALQGMMNQPDYETYPGDVNAPSADLLIAKWRKGIYARYANVSYLIADAMLAEREKENK